MTDSPNKNIFQRMVEVQKKVRTVIKAEKVQVSGERSYKAVSHDDVAALLHLPLAEAGIVLLPDVVEFTNSDFEVKKKNNYGEYVQRWYRTDLKIKVKWINADKPEDFIESTGASFALDTSDKSFSKAYSLALKIVLLKVHLLESRDGEEERIFEQDLPEKTIDKPLDKKPVTPPVPEKKKVNYAPASADLIDAIWCSAMDRGVSEKELMYLLSEGYGVIGDRQTPTWIAEEIADLLRNPETTAGKVMSEAVRVKTRREAALKAKGIVGP